MTMEDKRIQKAENDKRWGTEEEVLGFSRMIAHRIRRKIDRDIEIEDLISWGLMGFLEVREKHGEGDGHRPRARVVRFRGVAATTTPKRI